jgi:hypothetical protein
MSFDLLHFFSFLSPCRTFVLFFAPSSIPANAMLNKMLSHQKHNPHQQRKETREERKKEM